MAALSGVAGLVIVRIALLLSLAVNPFLLTRLLAPRAGRLFTLALSGAVFITPPGLNKGYSLVLMDDFYLLSSFGGLHSKDISRR